MQTMRNAFRCQLKSLRHQPLRRLEKVGEVGPEEIKRKRR